MMPQASAELQAEWGTADEPAIKFLEDAGYVLTRDWEWVVPTNHTITDKEKSAIRFLIEEWDFGGVTKRGDDAG